MVVESIPVKHFLFISSAVIYLGGVVKTDDLVDALKNKYFKAAALDVTDPEPLPDYHPLLKLDNVIVVPHWGSATIQVINFHVIILIKIYSQSKITSQLK